MNSVQSVQLVSSDKIAPEQAREVEIVTSTVLVASLVNDDDFNPDS